MLHGGHQRSGECPPVRRAAAVPRLRRGGCRTVTRARSVRVGARAPSRRASSENSRPHYGRAAQERATVHQPHTAPDTVPTVGAMPADATSAKAPVGVKTQVFVVREWRDLPGLELPARSTIGRSVRTQLGKRVPPGGRRLRSPPPRRAPRRQVRGAAGYESGRSPRDHDRGDGRGRFGCPGLSGHRRGPRLGRPTEWPRRRRG